MIPQYYGLIVGADPEIFIRSTCSGLIVASGEVLKKVKCSGVVPDGVQAEIHPYASNCTGQVGTTLLRVIVDWQKKLLKNGFTLDFTPTLELTEEEFSSLPTEARQLGCKPSFNIYGDRDLGVDSETYRWRSAGGHLHMGFNMSYMSLIKEHLGERLGDLVPLCDYLIGNTFVLFDRDPFAAKRREVYGRAGEYRLPSYGIEYRTLSNVWLRSSALQQLAYALCRAVVNTAAATVGITVKKDLIMSMADGKGEPLRNFAGELIECCPIKDIQEAIDSNNFDLALKNFERISKWISSYWVEDCENSMYTTGGDWPLSRTKIDDFLFFIEKGLTHWFGSDPSKWWEENFVSGSWLKGNAVVNPATGYCSNYHSYIGTSGATDPGHARGWNSFLLEVIRPQRLEAEKQKELAQLITQGAMIAAQENANVLHQ